MRKSGVSAKKHSASVRNATKAHISRVRTREPRSVGRSRRLRTR